MAKKSKTTKAKKAKTAKVSESRVVLVFGECSVAVGRGIEEIANKNSVQIDIDSDAIKYWATRYWKTIPKGLAKSKRGWKVDRRAVLAQAKSLGVTAAEKAVARIGTGPTACVIGTGDAREASKAISQDPRCQPIPGSGVYCQTNFA